MKAEFKAVLFVIIIYLFTVSMASYGYEIGERAARQDEAISTEDVENVDIDSIEIPNVKKNVSKKFEKVTENLISNNKAESILESENGMNVLEESTDTETPTNNEEENNLEEPKESSKEEIDTNVVEEKNDVDNSNLISLGEFKLTAYCSCTQCCGQYALNRPVDENGEEIVYGALGERLVAGVSIAVDPNVIPYYSKVVINGNTYIAHDTGGAIIDKRIDVYFDSHEDALNFGARRAEVFVVV